MLRIEVIHCHVRGQV